MVILVGFIQPVYDLGINSKLKGFHRVLDGSDAVIAMKEILKNSMVHFDDPFAGSSATQTVYLSSRIT